MSNGIAILALILSLTACEGMPASFDYAEIITSDVKEMLAKVGEARFIEDIAASDVGIPQNEWLLSMKEMYSPVSSKLKDLTLNEIVMNLGNIVYYIYRNESGDTFSLNWTRRFAWEYEYAITEGTGGFEQYKDFEDFASRGRFRDDQINFLIERNGILYGVIEQHGIDGTEELRGYLISWAQYGESFHAYIPKGVSLDDPLEFCRVRPMNAWETRGDAVSVSIQGMKSVEILDNKGGVIVIEDGVIYRLEPYPSSEAEVETVSAAAPVKTRIGYRWTIDEASLRYQYALEPGDYSFLAEGAAGVPQVLVKRFEAGEAVYAADHTEAAMSQGANKLRLDVAPQNLISAALPDAAN